MRMKYDPNNVVMLPMPSESYKITVNILVEREKNLHVEDVEEENGEDPSTADGQSKEEKEEKKTKKTKKPKKPVVVSRYRVNHFEIPYNFYGMCSELYEKVAAYLEVDSSRLDLIMKTISEFDNVG